MKRDTIFYKIFEQNPSLLFEFVDQKPANIFLVHKYHNNDFQV